jgi:hypothetical protein
VSATLIVGQTHSSLGEYLEGRAFTGMTSRKHGQQSTYFASRQDGFDPATKEQTCMNVAQKSRQFHVGHPMISLRVVTAEVRR